MSRKRGRSDRPADFDELNELVKAGELDPVALQAMTEIELAFLAGQEQPELGVTGSRSGSASSLSNRNARRARLQLEDKRAQRLQDQLASATWRAAVLGAVLAGTFTLIGVWLGSVLS